MKRVYDTAFLMRFGIILLIVITLMATGGCFMANLIDDDDDENPFWFRELRIDAWSLLSGDGGGIVSVKTKLETMYGSSAPEVKVDLANSEFSEGNWHYEFSQLAKQALSENNYLAATGYYTLAAYPQAYKDERAIEM